MVTYSKGDCVICKVYYGKLVQADSQKFEVLQHFDIVCICEEGYLLLVPRDLYLKNSFVLTDRDCKTFSIPIRFVDGIVHHANDKHIVSLRSQMNGLCCHKCNEFNEYGEVNRIDENGHGIYICYLCRINNYR